MVALAERLRLKLASSDRRILVGSQIIPDKARERKLTRREGACLLDASPGPSYAFVVVVFSHHNPFACSVIQP